MVCSAHKLNKQGDNKQPCLTPFLSNHQAFVLISHASKIILKNLHARLQHYMNWELPDVQAGFKKGRGTRNQIANIHWIIEKAGEFQKNIYFFFMDYTKDF